MKLLALAALLALAPAAALAHPHIVISQAVRAIESNGAYTHVEIVWKFDPHASEDEIPAIDEDKDGKFSEEEVRLLIRDTMPSFLKVGFLTWLNTGGADFNPGKEPDFKARIDDPATFNPPDWDRDAGDGMKMPENKRATLPLEPTKHSPRNLVYTMRFELPKPVKSFSITTYDPEDYMRVVVDKESLSKGCALDKHPTRKSEFVPGHPVYADRVTCHLP
ncbi:MAG TPA: DUF1007 family protein [Reyranella sp.]|jgi:ABC-type uncharacterized transport system substrate-binding protein